MEANGKGVRLALDGNAAQPATPSGPQIDTNKPMEANGKNVLCSNAVGERFVSSFSVNARASKEAWNSSQLHA